MTESDAIRDLLAAVVHQAIEDIRAEKPEWEPPTDEDYKKYVATQEKKGSAIRLREDFEAHRRLNHHDRVDRWRREKETAEQWIKSEASDYLFSFRSLCDHLDMNPSAVRKRLCEKAPPCGGSEGVEVP